MRARHKQMEMIDMLVPAKRSFFDDFMMSPFDAFFDGPAPVGKPAPNLMKADVKETETGFELLIDLPGVQKENVTAELKDGYLEVSAETHSKSEDKDDKGTYLRKERFDGKCSRSFYVGDDISEDDITAKFDNGVLTIDVPKKTKPALEEKKTIAIG